MGSRELNVVVVLLCSLVAVLGFGVEVTAHSTQKLIAVSHIGAGENHQTFFILQYEVKNETNVKEFKEMMHGLTKLLHFLEHSF